MLSPAACLLEEPGITCASMALAVGIMREEIASLLIAIVKLNSQRLTATIHVCGYVLHMRAHGLLAVSPSL